MTNWFVFCPFGEKAEILRYAQDDQTTVGSERGLLPLPNIGRSFAQDDNQWRRDESPPPTPPKNTFIV